MMIKFYFHLKYKKMLLCYIISLFGIFYQKGSHVIERENLNKKECIRSECYYKITIFSRF